MGAQEKRGTQTLMETLVYFNEFNGDNETYMRTTELGDLRMLIFQYVFHQN